MKSKRKLTAVTQRPSTIFKETTVNMKWIAVFPLIVKQIVENFWKLVKRKMHIRSVSNNWFGVNKLGCKASFGQKMAEQATLHMAAIQSRSRGCRPETKHSVAVFNLNLPWSSSNKILKYFGLTNAPHTNALSSYCVSYVLWKHHIDRKEGGVC